MFRNLFIICCIFIGHQAFAQNSNANVSIPPKSIKPSPNFVPEQAIGAPLPPFILVSMAQPVVSGNTVTINTKPSSYTTNKEVQYDANLFVMFFNPNCGHCENMTMLLEQNMSLFKKTKVLLVAAPNQRPLVPNFLKDYNISQYPSLVVGLDSLNLIGKLFLYKSLPQINIYDKERKLLKVFSGDTPIDSLKPYIQ